jgi:tetratricopeptide (TPR) repeat protein
MLKWGVHLLSLWRGPLPDDQPEEAAMAIAEPLTFGLLLKRYRRAAGLTQEALAARASYSATYISMLERGERTPQRATAELLSQALGLSTAERATFLAAHIERPRAPPLAVPQRSTPPPLVGRTDELAALTQHLEGCGPAFLAIAGEPGIGKTRLLREAARLALASGWVVLEAGCHRSGGQGPYAPLLSAIERHLQRQSLTQLRAALSGGSWLVRLLPELAETRLMPLPEWSLPPVQERRLMFAAVCRFLANIAGPTGTLLILDDLQWADADALDLLAFALRQDSDRPLRVLGAYRSTEVRVGDPLEAALADLVREGLVARRDLGPLLFDEAMALLGTQLGPLTAETTALAERLLRRAGGVPFFLLSLTQGVTSNGLDARAGEQIPVDVVESIFQRIALLTATAQELLGVAAVLGRTMRGDMLALVSDLAEGERIAALEAICQARLLVEEADDAYRFTHDLIREAVENNLSAARRRMMHRRVAEALEQQPAPPVEELAYHYHHSDRQDHALHYALLAAAQAETRRAHAEAEEHYRRALALARKLGDRPREAAALEQLGVLLDVTANMQQSREALEQSIQAYRAAGDDEGLRRGLGRLTRVYKASGMPPQVGLAFLQQFLPPLLEGAPSVGRVMLHIGLARLSSGTGQFKDQIVEAEHAGIAARALGDAGLVAEAEVWRSSALANLGRIEESLRVAEQALPLAQDMGAFWQESFLLANMAWAYQRLGMMLQSAETAARTVEVAHRMGLPGPEILALCNRSEVAFYLGDWRQAREDVERAMALVRPLGMYWNAAAPRVLLGRLCLAEGQPEAGKRYLEEGIALAERMQESLNSRESSVTLGRGAIAECELLAARAGRAHTDQAPVLAAAAGRDGCRAMILPYLAWAYLDAGDPESATALLDEGIADARARHDWMPLLEALLVRARVELHQQRWPDAHDTLASALALARALPTPYAEAKALYLCGLLHARRGEITLARARLADALTILRRLGEHLYHDQIEQVLAGLEQH